MGNDILNLIVQTIKRKPKQAGIILSAVVAAILGTSMTPQGLTAYDKSGKNNTHKSGKFDYYTMVLSWSPTYCEKNKNDRTQCGRQRKYDFVVHGLWPQYNKGWPQNCRVSKGQYYVSDKTAKSMLDIMPSKRLVIHEWRKHGTCSGLTQDRYFQLTRKVHEVIKKPREFKNPNRMISTTPAKLKAAFVRTNPWLKPEMISVQCGNRRDRGRLSDLRFCFTKGFKPMACGKNEKRSCKAKTLMLPPVR